MAFSWGCARLKFFSIELIMQSRCLDHFVIQHLGTMPHKLTSMVFFVQRTIFLLFSNHHHHQLNVHFFHVRLIKGMNGCFPTALGIPLATFWNLPFSHSDASISRKSCLVTILKAALYP